MGSLVLVDETHPGPESLATRIPPESGHSLFVAPAVKALLAADWTKPAAVLLRVRNDSRGLMQACLELKRDRRLEQVPLIACGSGSVHAEQAFAGGADDFWQMPGDIREIGVRVTAAEARPLPLSPRQQTGLVVDDDRFFRRSLADQLAREGYPTLEAESGSQALELLEQHSPSLAVVDLFMPGLGGVELVQRLRAMPRWQRLPVVAISGVRAATEKGLVAALDRLQVHDFIDKRGPALDSLTATVDDLLRSDPDRHRPPRVSAKFLAEFRPTAEGPWISGFVSELGLGGAFVRTLVLPPAEVMLPFRLDWGEAGSRMVCSARVVWTRPRTAAGGGGGLGGAVAGGGPAAGAGVNAFVYR